ncbi:MAG: hypothetical protein RJA22_2877 [Verrucomicrobiota bacterium]|jgi:uncharacterized membrane protein/mono/diheme cytochrome c family protein
MIWILRCSRLLVALAIGWWSTAAWAATNPPAAAVATTPSLFEWRPFLAPFHSVVLHFPIGFATMAVILEFYRWRKPGGELKAVSRLVLWLSLATGFLSAALGILRAGSGGYDPETLGLHRLYGLAIPAVTLLTLAVQRVAFRTDTGRAWPQVYRAFLATTLVLLLIAGHYGGNLTHGSNYLTENAPRFVREWLGEGDPSAATAAGNPGAAEPSGLDLFLTRVRPAWEAKCFRCHGPEKQKGGCRLDLAESAQQAGDSGRPAVVPGRPMESEVVRLVLLPRDHDEAMPPAGKEPLTAEEILAVIQWIQQGAPFPRPAGAAR